MGTGKKVVTPPARREVARSLRVEHSISERRAASLSGSHRSTVRYKISRKDDVRLRGRLLELAALRPLQGYDFFWRILRREGYLVNRKRVLRLYREERLALRKKPRKKLVAAAAREKPVNPQAPHQRWRWISCAMR